MYEHITEMEPLYPAHAEKLEDVAREVVAVSAKLEGRLTSPTLAGIRSLLMVVNSYYSNLIEGHSTHPIDIERAMRRDYSADQAKRDLQIESAIHIEVQEELAKRLRAEPELNVASPEVLLWVHERFYSRRLLVSGSLPAGENGGVGVVSFFMAFYFFQIVPEAI